VSARWCFPLLCRRRNWPRPALRELIMARNTGVIPKVCQIIIQTSQQRASHADPQQRDQA
jgi:hypothetical protein